MILTTNWSSFKNLCVGCGKPLHRWNKHTYHNKKCFAKYCKILNSATFDGPMTATEVEARNIMFKKKCKKLDVENKKKFNQALSPIVKRCREILKKNGISTKKIPK